MRPRSPTVLALAAAVVLAAGCGDDDEMTGGVGAPRTPQEIQQPAQLPAVVVERVVEAEREIRAACADREDADLGLAVRNLTDRHQRYTDSLVQTPNADDVRRTEEVVRMNAGALRTCGEDDQAERLERALG
jgi:hypothetical protein